MFKKLGKAIGFVTVAAAAAAGGIALYNKFKKSDEDVDKFDDFEDDDFDDDFSDVDVENRGYTPITPEEETAAADNTEEVPDTASAN